MRDATAGKGESVNEIERTRDQSVGTRDIGSLQPRRMKPVKWWAFLGACYITLIIYTVTRWLVGGHAKPVTVGETPPEGYMVFMVRLSEIAMVLFACAALYFAIIGPLRRDRRLSFDGYMFIALTLLWWEDPLANYFQAYVTFNAAAVNLGCPQCYLPGWKSPADRMVEPILWDWMFYIGLCWFLVVGGSNVMRLARRRWPQLGTVGLLAMFTAGAFVFDLLTEFIWARSGVYIFAGAHGLTLFEGHFYQVPLLHILFVSFWYTALVSIRYFRNDKDQTIAERGIDDVRVPRPARPVLRLLAVIGAYHTAMLVVYALPIALVGLQMNSWPPDVYNRPYLTHGMCGPSTDYACPDERLPIRNGDGAARITPDGKIHAPNGLPVEAKP